MRQLLSFVSLWSLMILLFACGGGTTPTTVVGNLATLKPGTAVKISLTDTANNASLNFNFAANAVNKPTNVTVSIVPLSALPGRLRKVVAYSAYSTNSGNVYVTAFKFDSPDVAAFNVPIPLSGSVNATIASGTVLNVAKYDGNTWADVTTVTVGADGALSQSLISATLPGLTEPGTYLIYLPAAGTSTAVSNFGIALIADDGNGIGTSYTHGVQVINLFDASGNPLAKPTIKFLNYTGARDIDGAALTPDGSQGLFVDGGNTVRFFSGVQTGTPVASTTTVDVTAYGGDGDSVAIMPNGDEAVVSADSNKQNGVITYQLVVISGITSGTPQAAEIITLPDARDGLMISNDGKVLLARGYNGLTVFSIADIAPVPGSLGGTISHSFTQTANFASLGAFTLQDGRDGIAISPSDSNRAVIIDTLTTYTPQFTLVPQITLLTALTGSPAVGAPVILTGAGYVYSVAITPDGKSAVVGTDKGIVLVSGVDTGTLTQVGATPYAPPITVNGSTVTLPYVPTLGITLDGKYVVVCSSIDRGGTANGTLLVIPFVFDTTDTTKIIGFGTVVGQLDGIAVPGNDQMILH